ncbi:MAG TPA: hypothetical protein DD706_24655 [Nitrospiraceae bacterium]|nr:hypothetical protein [Nitrospiraceae bacterium]
MIDIDIDIDAGFRSGSRGPFVSAKGPKTMLAIMCPFGFPARFADTGVAQTRCAQTMRDFFPVSTALLGHIIRPGEPAETMSPLANSGVYPGPQTRPAGS